MSPIKRPGADAEMAQNIADAINLNDRLKPDEKAQTRELVLEASDQIRSAPGMVAKVKKAIVTGLDKQIPHLADYLSGFAAPDSCEVDLLQDLNRIRATTEDITEQFTGHDTMLANVWRRIPLASEDRMYHALVAALAFSAVYAEVDWDDHIDMLKGQKPKK